MKRKRYEKTTYHLEARELEYDDNIFLKAGNVKIYKNVKFITPGEWSDMITNAPVLWAEDKLKKFSTNWYSNYVNLGHSHEPLAFIGTVQNQKWFNGAVIGDLHINPKLTNGKDTIEGIDSHLLNHVSIEVGTEDYWDSAKQKRCADNIIFLGVSIIGPWPGGACPDAKIHQDR